MAREFIRGFATGAQEAVLSPFTAKTESGIRAGIVFSGVLMQDFISGSAGGESIGLDETLSDALAQAALAYMFDRFRLGASDANEQMLANFGHEIAENTELKEKTIMGLKAAYTVVFSTAGATLSRAFASGKLGL